MDAILQAQSVEGGHRMSYDDWISCDDKLPEREDEYLVTWEGTIGENIRHTGMSIMYYDITKDDDDEEIRYWDTEEVEGNGYRDVQVTAWMELPERYRGDEDS